MLVRSPLQMWNINPFDLYYGCMRVLNKSLLTSQIAVFLSWGLRSQVSSETHKKWLVMFSDFTHREDVLDVTQADVDLFLRHVYNTHKTSYEVVQATKAVKQLMKFYMARSKNGKAQLGRGRPPKINEANTVLELRSVKNKKGKPMLSFRQIGRIMNKDVAQVYKWFQLALRLK